MTSYTAVPSTDIDADSPITETLMTLLRDNPIAISEGSAGAPKILLAAMNAGSVDTSQLVAAAVGRSEIANSVTTSAGSVLANDNVEISLNDWALFPMVHVTDNDETVSMGGNSVDGTSAASPRFQLLNSSAVSETYDVDHRWIIAA